MMETEAVVAQGTLTVTCPRDELTRALGIVSRGVSTRTTVQILAGILLRASGDKLELAATDMELSLRTSIDVQGATEGSVVVPGRLLLDLARLLPAAEVSIEHKPEEAVVEHPVRPEAWGVCLRQQKNALFDALLYKKHPQLYRQRIDPMPPWNYFAVVGLAIAAPLLALAGHPSLALTALALVLVLVLEFAWRRLRHTAHTPRHVWEMLATSAIIPFLSVYWRLRGAIRYRVLFL